jgi:hypothetical protein
MLIALCNDKCVDNAHIMNDSFILVNMINRLEVIELLGII